MHSEVGRLRQVIVHRPGRELERLSPANREALLFDEVPWAERAVVEHDALTRLLCDQGAEVLRVVDLLGEALEDEGARTFVLDATLADPALGVALPGLLRRWLESIPADELARRLIAGVTVGELPEREGSLVAALGDRHDFVLTPLPNHLYARDASAWSYDGVCVHAMAKPVRRREALHFEAIYRFHPRFTAAAPPLWHDGLGGAAALEGGDVFVLGRGRLLIGVGERSRPGAVELLAQRLFAAGAAMEVLVTPLPGGRSTIHLDALLTFVDRDACAVFHPARAALRAFALRPGRGGVRVADEGSLLDAVARALEVDRLRLIENRSETAAREQWDEGNNLVAVRPGVVIAYERNAHTNAVLREEGIDVLTIPDGELARGRGGPRCLTCPVARDPA